MLQTIVHYSLHLLAPGLLAVLFYRRIWVKAWIIMLLTMAVDLDHLLADPVFDPDRCSIGYHFLHTWPAFLVYIALMLSRNRTVRIIGLGLLFHMLTDFIDCLWMFTECRSCCERSALNWLCDLWLDQEN